MKDKQTGLIVTVVAATFLSMALGCSRPTGQGSLSGSQSVRLYVLDCGILHNADAGRFNFNKEELGITDMSVACFLIRHPKGILIWDTGAVPDGTWKPTGNPIVQHILLPDSQERNVTMVKPLSSQLAELGYSPSDITYLALSHYHYDHTANANDFAGATWLVHKVERDAMFNDKPPGTTQPSTYAALRNSKSSY